MLVEGDLLSDREISIKPVSKIPSVDHLVAIMKKRCIFAALYKTDIN